MLGGEAETVADAPVDRVFSYLADFTRYPEWFSGWRIGKLMDVRQTSLGPVGEGSTFDWLIRSYMGEGGHMTKWYGVKVTAFVPNRRIEFELETLDGCRRYYISLLPLPNGTRIIKRWKFARLSLGYKLFAPVWFPVLLLLLPVSWWQQARELRRLKERVESLP